MVYTHRGHYAEALVNFQQSLVISHETDDRAREGTTSNNMGLVYYGQGHYEKALAVFEQALAISRELGNRAEEGTTLSNIGRVYRAQGRYEEALAIYEQALAIHQKVGRRLGEGVTLNNIGSVHSNQGRYGEALATYEQALAISREIGDRVMEGTSLNNIGMAYQDQGRYEEALDNFQQSLAIHREIGYQAGEGVTLNNIGLVYSGQGRYIEALDTYQQVLAIHREVGRRPGEGTTLNNIGWIYEAQGRYEEALATYEQALVIHREVGNRAGEGTTLANIGLVYSDQGRYAEALDYFQQSLALRLEVGDRAGEGVILNNIGGIYEAQGHYVKALDSFQQSLAIRREVGNRAGEGTTLANIGLIYADQGRYGETLATYEQALAIHQEVGNRTMEGTTLNNIGGVYRAQGRYTEALDSFQQSLTIFREVGNRAGEGTTLANIGLIYADQGRYGEALATYEQALAIHQEVGNRTMEGTTLNNIGNVYRTQGRYVEALDSFQQSLAINREVSNRLMEGTVLDNMGEMYRTQGRYAEALDNYQKAIAVFEAIRVMAGSEEGRAGFIAQYISLYDHTVLLLHQEGRGKDAFFTSERGRARAFLDSLATGQVQLSDNTAAGLLAQEQEAYAQRQTIQDNLAKARALTPPDPTLVAGLETQLVEIEATYAEIQAKIESRGGQLTDLVPGRSSQNVLGVSEVQVLLDPQATLLAYYILDEQTLVFFITADNFEVIELDISRENLTNKINRFRKLVDLKDTNTTGQAAQELYQMLIKPVQTAEVLKTSAVSTRLMIVPHGVLHYLPFAALLNPETGRYLLQDYSLVTLPSASALPFIQENSHPPAGSEPAGEFALVIGNPTTGDFDATASLAAERDGLGSLPFAEKEAEIIAALYGVEPLIGETATEKAVREQVGGSGILHLAAHGYYNPVAPLSSLIALAPDDPSTGSGQATYDGWLTVGEVYGLDLNQTGLVVLSACQTQWGELSAGDELVGLTRAFIFAGTPTVVASLWNVDDEATSLLMGRFCSHLIEGMSKAEALRQAQLETMAEYPDPFYWAAFVLSGDGGEVSRGAVEQGSGGMTEQGGGCFGWLVGEWSSS